MGDLFGSRPKPKVVAPTPVAPPPAREARATATAPEVTNPEVARKQADRRRTRIFASAAFAQQNRPAAQSAVLGSGIRL